MHEDNDTPSNNIATAIEAGKAQHAIQPVTGPNGRIIGHLHRSDLKLTEIDEKKFYGTPFRSVLNIRAFAVEDFVTALRRYSQPSPNTVSVSAARNEFKIQAILNDQEFNPSAQPGELIHFSPGWRDSTITMTLTESEELLTWRKVIGTWTSQLDFANFLEENPEDCLESIALLEAAKNLSLTRDSACKSAIRTDNGSVRFQFSDDIRSETELPEKITIIIPLFRGGPRYQFKAFLRYRLREGQIHFSVKPILLERSIDDCFEDTLKQVSDLIDYPVIRVS